MKGQALKKLFIFFALIAFVAGRPSAAVAARDTCTQAARLAAAESGVPADILLAITLVETRRDGTPWPWTLNHDGRGHWFPSAADAEDAASRILAAGGMADIGCFQLNSRWHGAAFASVDQMLDPFENALYAARYLRRLHGETGDWSAAIAAYHSRDPARGQAYLDRVASHLGNPPRDLETTAAPNRFPLLHSGKPGSVGTIVPQLAGISPLIGGP